jgi:hypothetical protein
MNHHHCKLFAALLTACMLCACGGNDDDKTTAALSWSACPVTPLAASSAPGSTAIADIYAGASCTTQRAPLLRGQPQGRNINVATSRHCSAATHQGSMLLLGGFIDGADNTPLLPAIASRAERCSSADAGVLRDLLARLNDSGGAPSFPLVEFNAANSLTAMCLMRNAYATSSRAQIDAMA